MDPTHYRIFHIRPALHRLHPEIPYSPAAEQLIMGTAWVESDGLRYVRQLPRADGRRGPAFGYLQVESGSHRDQWRHFLMYGREALRRKVIGLAGGDGYLGAGRGFDDRMLIDSPGYCVAIARLVYWRVPEALPAADDIVAQAAYWKRYYNSAAGAGDPAQYIARHARLVAAEHASPDSGLLDGES